VERVLSEKRIVFLLFEAILGARTLFVARGRVTRHRFAERFRFGALESNNFLRHRGYSLLSAAGAASSSSPSPPSSSVKPKSEVTEGRMRVALFCFSSCD